jgi:CheY-like chemotaxis protein
MTARRHHRAKLIGHVRILWLALPPAFRGRETMGQMLRSVLVVDDDVSFRQLASRVVTSWGHIVVAEAGSVVEAIERAIELRPDAVLADIGLPDGDGFGLTRDLLALPSPPRVVLISSDSDAANGPAATRVGAYGFVPKDELVGLLLRRMLEEN